MGWDIWEGGGVGGQNHLTTAHSPTQVGDGWDTTPQGNRQNASGKCVCVYVCVSVCVCMCVCVSVIAKTELKTKLNMKLNIAEPKRHWKMAKWPDRR